jgi:DNA-binding response OmpR family regulator
MSGDTVLVVDDEERVTEAYKLWLEGSYDVRTATGGEEAMAELDEATDVVLLDRQMPGLSGDEVLERIREAGYDCRVAMVTGVDPDFDITELPFDDYVTKPVKKDDLAAVVENLLSVSGFDEKSQELFAVSQKQAALEAEKSAAELEASEEYGRLESRAQELRLSLDDAIQEMDDEEMDELFREF